MCCRISSFSFFFFNDTATTEIYTLSLHDALPICHRLEGRLLLRLFLPVRSQGVRQRSYFFEERLVQLMRNDRRTDRKSTRLNSSHLVISYAVFCLKKKKKKKAVIHSAILAILYRL